MSNKLACHDQETNSDGKVWNLWLIKSWSLGTSLVSAFTEKCEKILLISQLLLVDRWIWNSTCKCYKLKGNYYLSSCIFHLIGKGDCYLSSCISLIGKGNHYLLPCIFHLMGKGEYYLSTCILNLIGKGDYYHSPRNTY